MAQKMIKSILIITSSFDRTVDYLIEKFSSTKFIRLNVDELDKYKISVISNPKYIVSLKSSEID